MKKLLFIHSVIEMIGGVVLVFRPDLFLMTANQDVSTLLLAKMYAILAFTFGALSFFMYKMFAYNDVFKKIIMILIAFHLMIALQAFSGFNQGLVANVGPFGLHIALAAIFAVGYMKEINSFS